MDWGKSEGSSNQTNCCPAIQRSSKNPFFRNPAGLAFEDAEWYHVMTPEGPAEISKTQAQRIDQGNSTTPRQLIEMAEQFLDLPYVWAGISSSGFDCSGFMYSLHRVNGILIPRDTIEQAQAGVQRSYEQAQPGDLLLFAYEEEKEKSITSVFI